ncbi:MAG: DEAD/DEAH box helicase [Spirochaetaceae bacterium]|nr:DEAD/DEAH box helicase [Spirochaetaceae bacterium]
MNSFLELGTAPFFIERLAGRDIDGPTEIQRLALPPLFAGESVLFSSATGTGKTFAYLIPLFQSLFLPGGGAAENDTNDGERRAGWPRLLICAPTYELCSQIKGEADFLLWGLPVKTAPLKAGLVIGASAMGRQIDTLKKDKPRVIIGNPGRLLQLARMGKLRLKAVEALVLDEGDRLTADELFAGTRELVSLANPHRQTVACSATVPAGSRERLIPLMGGAPRIIHTGNLDALRGAIEHWAVFSEERRKISVLRSVVAAAAPRKALVFTTRPWQVENIASQLRYHHLAADALHGDMDKNMRKQALENFRRGRTGVLVTSDLAARGLDISGVTHVIALDVPETGDPYLHRAGRTGRAGNRGVMISIGDENELRRLAKLEKKLGIRICPKELYKGKILAPPDDSERSNEAASGIRSGSGSRTRG